MTPQQNIVAAAGVGLIVFRLFTSQQRQALGALLGAAPDGAGTPLAGTPLDPSTYLDPAKPGSLFSPLPAPQVAPGAPVPIVQGPHNPILGPLGPNGDGGATQGTGPGQLLPPGTLTPPAAGPTNADPFSVLLGIGR